MANWQLKLIGLLLLFMIAGCSEPPDAVKSIVITPSSGSVGVNKTQQYYATVFNFSNQVVVKTVTWSVTGGIGTIDSTGKFTAGSSLASGTIVAQADSASTTINVNITDKGKISGTLFDTDGAKAAGVNVYLSDLPAFAGNSDINGAYSISDIPVGTHEVKTQENILHLSATKVITIEAGTSLSQDLILPLRFTVTETIQDLGGIMNVAVTVTNNGSTTASGVTAIYRFYDDEGSLIGSGTVVLGTVAAQATATGSFSIVSETYSTYTKTVTATSY